jgi:hypothetical protein
LDSVNKSLFVSWGRRYHDGKAELILAEADQFQLTSNRALAFVAGRARGAREVRVERGCAEEHWSVRSAAAVAGAAFSGAACVFTPVLSLTSGASSRSRAQQCPHAARSEPWAIAKEEVG